MHAWDISQLTDLDYRRAKLSNLAKRIAALLERAKVNFPRQLSAKLFSRLFQRLYTAEGICSTNSAGGALIVVARKPGILE